MKISKLVLQNIGPYVGAHTLLFNNNEENKNITLIGGKNGAGKTVIFSSIKLCLYGHKAYGYQSTGHNYYKEVYKLINTELKTKQNDKAQIILDIIVDDGKYNHNFSIKRSWEFNGKTIQENCLVSRNGNVIADDELNNFMNYLDNLISPELFTFYFFDGEKISNYFLSDNANNNFKKAFLSLCGLDSISIMVKNFERIYKSKQKRSSCSQLYYDTKKKISDKNAEIEKASWELSELKKIEEETNEKIAALDNIYAKSGGLDIEEWKNLNYIILFEESTREEISKKLKDIALHNIPFIIMSKQLNKLKEQIIKENEHMKARLLKEALNNEEVKSLLSESVLKKVDINSLIDAICKTANNVTTDNDFESILCLSKSDSYKLQQLIYEKARYDSSEIVALNKKRAKSIRITNKTRLKLSHNNIDKMHDYIKEREEYNKLLNKILVKISDLSNQIEILYDEFKIIQENYIKITKEFELELKKYSISDMSSKLMYAYRNIEEKLISKYAEILQKKFMQNFEALINKNKFIDGIEIDLKLNVKPYKNMKISKEEFLSLLDKQGEEYYINEIGVRSITDIEKAKKSKFKSIKLPVFIKSEFSKGEKQVYIMALYLSLLQMSKSDVPFIIDTPFARIDSEHRSKIIEYFFKKVNSQVIILSTDEEIIGDNKKQLDEKVSGTILLKSLSHGTTEVLQNKYFEEKHGI